MQADASCSRSHDQLQCFSNLQSNVTVVTELNTGTHLSSAIIDLVLPHVHYNRKDKALGPRYTCTDVAHAPVTQTSQFMHGGLLYLAAWAKAVSSYDGSGHHEMHMSYNTKLLVPSQRCFGKSSLVSSLHIQLKLRQAMFLGTCFLRVPGQGPMG